VICYQFTIVEGEKQLGELIHYLRREDLYSCARKSIFKPVLLPQVVEKQSTRPMDVARQGWL
jgi:hypothetical protein